MVPSETTEELILQAQLAEREKMTLVQRAAVLRVYNYYRIILSFLLMILFYEIPDQTFVGAASPDWFQTIVLTYVIFNVATGFYCLVVDETRITTPLIIGFTLSDLVFVTALMITSGGVESGLDSLLIFATAFGGVMIRGQISYLFPSSALFLSFLTATYTRIMDAESGLQHFFDVALIGVAVFAVNALLQYVSGKLKQQELEFVSLSALDKMRELADSSREELEEQYDRFNVLLTSTSEGVLGLNNKAIVIFANPKACELLDITQEDIIDRDFQDFMCESETVMPFQLPSVFILLGISPRTNYDADRWRTDKGEPFIVDHSFEETTNREGTKTGAVILFKNVTEQRENEERLEYLANHDPLTELPNRVRFKEILNIAHSRTAKTERETALLIVDLDDFTRINEQVGHDVGDEILRTVSQRLRSAVGPGDLVARVAADQFAIMLNDLNLDLDVNLGEHAAAISDKIIAAVSEPLISPSEPEFITASVGITVSGDEAKDADELLSNAISAVGSAKTNGRNQYCFFQPEMQQKAEEKKRIQMLLRGAIDNGEFNLVYQPIVDIKSGKIDSSEALIRWNTSESGPIRPDVFIPIAEESGQINRIGAWVLETVSKQVKSWGEDVGDYPGITINISSKQLKNDQFRKQFTEMIETYGVPVSKVELELTEPGALEDPEMCLEELVKLHELGVKISIDDFGTGYSSLDYLRRLPLDLLKIDRRFTKGIGKSESEEEIVLVMIRMAHALDLKVLCEGVETEEQLKFLKEHDCDFVQGYLFSKPKSAEDIMQMITGEQDGTYDIMDVRKH